ncbi:ADP-ribosylation/Crystallin J1 [Scenedesmus sp. NREL 46B-D3]|nr:ADP-ribosylation/Crystallin J1 [Scenedesmus sp. NREL 46B-D3]
MDAAADAAYGSLLGACVGDAAGAVLEFMHRMSTEDEVEEALQMPGGGLWQVGPGQVTDDSELALCMAQALLNSPASSRTVPLDTVAAWYGKWLHSPPFDIGSTTRAALSAARGNPVVEGLAARMTAAAAQNSLAAALPQVTPPGGTHSSTSGGSASSAQPGSQASCEHDVSADSAADVKPKAAAAREAVLSWLGEAQQDGPGPEVYHAAGFMKWGFVHAFRALALTLPFEEALRQLHGGDKNTNAVIVGGLLGAYWGAEGISATLTGPVLCRCSSSVGIKRPEFLQTGQLPELFEKLWAAASS